MIVELSKCKVELKEDKLKWGEREIIKFTLIDPETSAISAKSMLESRIKRFEFAIQSIKENEKEVSFSKEWVMNLSTEDGEKLTDVVNGIDLKKNIESIQEKSSEKDIQVKS